LVFKAAFIDSELEKKYLHEKLQSGRIAALPPVPQLTAGDIDAATHVVAMMGTEPYVAALKEGAEVIVGGRTTDPALFAAVPIWKGIPPAIAWHMAKVIDHGATNLEADPKNSPMLHSAPAWIVGVAAKDHFRIVATNTNGKCTALRVARSTLHENTSSTSFLEPPGRIDISRCSFAQIDDQTVKVTGVEFEERPYTLKLEGAKSVGFRAITLCGFRAETVTKEIDALIEHGRVQIQRRAELQGIDRGQYRLMFHIYGKNEIMRCREPGGQDYVPREVCVLADCVAVTKEIAHTIMVMTELELHVIAGPDEGGAFPLSPQVIETGEVFEFHIWHVMRVDDPLECVKIDLATMGGNDESFSETR
jgi:hypothetical protein